MNDYELEIYNKVKEEKQKEIMKNTDKVIEHFCKILTALILLIGSAGNVVIFSIVSYLTNFSNKYIILLLVINMLLFLICSYTYIEVFKNE